MITDSQTQGVGDLVNPIERTIHPGTMVEVGEATVYDGIMVGWLQYRGKVPGCQDKTTDKTRVITIYYAIGLVTDFSIRRRFSTAGTFPPHTEQRLSGFLPSFNH
jgi:hypothetical protein